MENTLKNMRKQKGITLIALVVTIVVLLILAAVTINLVLADGGIFSKAEQAEEAQKKAEVTDLVSMILADAKIEKMVYKRDVLDFLTEKQKDGKLYRVTDNGDGTITIEKDGYTFIIDEKTTKILEISENTRTVRIALDKTVVEPNEEVTVTIDIIGEDINKVLKWEFTNESEKLGTDESKYTNKYTSNEIKLSKPEEGTYYLHLLVEDTSENKEEKISEPIKVMPNPVTSITLDKTSLELNKGETYTLTATVLPENAGNKNINWTSSDETVATVDSTGKITTLKLGETIITATAADGSGITKQCTLKVIQKVTAISLSQTTATVAIGKTKTLTAIIEPSDATNKTLTWKSSATSVATVDSTGKITGVAVGTATITVVAADGSGKTATCTVTVEEDDWELLSKIAKEISNSSTITKESAEATVTVDETSYTLKVGDIHKVNYDGEVKKVRIMGFNHDKLSSTSAYGGTNTYAGISFEFVDCITSLEMNSSDTTSGGWGSCELRSTLNNTIVTKLSNKDYIKSVDKSYIGTYNSASSVTTVSDKLWLLACSEIWDNGYTKGAYGNAITNESTLYSTSDTQTQYKYYLDNLGSTTYRAQTGLTKKSSASGCVTWWLRSLNHSGGEYFSNVDVNGYCGNNGASNSNWVAPGFSI